MSQANRSKQKEQAKETIQVGWLRAMYLANVLVSLPLGLAVLTAPGAMRGALGIPAGDPVHYGIASGAIPLAFGVAGAAGLWFPVRLSPVLGRTDKQKIQGRGIFVGRSASTGLFRPV